MAPHPTCSAEWFSTLRSLRLQTPPRLRCQVCHLLLCWALQCSYVLFLSSLFSLFFFNQILRSISETNNAFSYVDIIFTKYSHLIFSLNIRCLGILFDIFPDVVTTYLVSQRAEIPQKDDSFLNPRGIMSKLLTNNQVRVSKDIFIFWNETGCNFHSIIKIYVFNSFEPFTFGLQVDLKIRIRLMKIVMGVSKVSKCLYDPYLKLKKRDVSPLVLTPLILHPPTLFRLPLLWALAWCRGPRNSCSPLRCIKHLWLV